MLEALIVSAVEIIEAKSVVVLWVIEEKTLDAIIEVVNSTMDEAEKVDSQMVDAITDVQDSEMVDGLVGMCTFWSLAIRVIGMNRLMKITVIGSQSYGP